MVRMVRMVGVFRGVVMGGVVGAVAVAVVVIVQWDGGFGWSGGGV